MILLYSQYLP